MHLSVNRRWRGFVAVAALLCGVSLIGLGVRGHVPPVLLLYVPAIYLIAVLDEFAAFLLLAVLFAQTRQRVLAPLALAFLGCSLTSGAILASFPIPGTTGGALPDTAASPWLTVLWHVILAAGAIWYAIERPRNETLSASSTRWFLFLVLPLTTAAGIVLMALILSHAASLTLLVSHTGAFQNNAIGYGYGSAAIVTVAFVAVMQALRRADPTRIDIAIAIGTFSATVGTWSVLASDSRLALAWVITRVLFLLVSLFMVVAVIRHLVDGLNDSLRIQAEALRTQVRTFEQNAAVEASLVKERFAATISHELRTPLGGIIGMAELLDRTSLTERQRSWTTAIRHSADTLLRIVNDVLDFSRVESGQLEFEEIPYSLGQLVDDVALLFREQARKNGVALLAFVDPTLPETALGDPVRIKQVLQNLVNNAVRFTHAGSIRIEVAPECVLPDAPMIRFSVHDTGIGIAPSAQERIFSPFVQADASTARRFGGTGLGLAIARHLVELMGGRISVGSRVGIGSTFTFTIPLRTALAADENQVPLRDLRILVVEPDDTVRELLRRYVDGWEMRSETVTSLAEAHANVVERGCENGRYAVVLVGSGIAPAEASRFVDDVRAIRALRDTSFLYLCSDRADDHPCPPGFDDCVPGALRQSKLFDVICRLTHRDLASRIVPPPDTAQRRPRSERILIAEDNEVNQALLAAQLEHLGFTADVVGNGAAAVEAVATHSYDLIFMDVQMPGMDGFEAARRIRASAKQTTPLPIIAVTANVLPGYRDVCLAAGMNDYLTKPALIAPLTAMVDHWLPALRTPAAPAPPPPAAPDFRQRLRSIFHGDDARVEATVALALTSLNDCMTTLRAALVEHDAPAAARVTHKLKGVAMEIGFVGIVDLARELERAIGANDWAAIDVAHVALGRAIDEELPPAENGPT